MRLMGELALLLLCLDSLSIVLAQEEAPGQPAVFVEGTEAGGERRLTARVITSGPLEGVTVRFAAERLFGLLPLGEADTDEHGLASIPFPHDIPGDEHGNVRIVATVEATGELAQAEARAVIGWGVPVPVEVEPFPPALWSPRAPQGLVAVIGVLFGGIWLTYGFVLVQLARIALGGGRPS